MRYPALLLLGLLVLAALLLPWPDDDDAALSPTGAPIVSAGQIGPPTPGDVDCSGELTVFDALLVLRFIVASPPFPDCIDRADKDCDGDTDVFDAASILLQVAGLAALGASPHCLPTPTPQACSPWPPEIIAIMESLPVVEGLCLLRFSDASEFPERKPGCAQAGACYNAERREVWYLFAAPVTELHKIAHEVCHAHQHKVVLDAGLTRLPRDWYETPEGISFIEITAWRFENEKWIEQPEPWSSGYGYPNPYEDAAEVCVAWYKVGAFPPDILREQAPLRYQWARQWLPLPP